MNSASEKLKYDLKQFYGSEKIYRHGLNSRVLYTEGVSYFANNAGAFWLLDILATEPEILKAAQDRAFVTVSSQDNKAKILVHDDGVVFFERDIGFTDLPEGDWKFFFFNNTILLPSEY